MPRVLSYTPSWVSRPSPGFQVFQSTNKGKSTHPFPNGSNIGSQGQQPNRTIARRGTEIYVVTGNEIRWTDLVMLKENEEETSASLAASRNGRVSVRESHEGSDLKCYRALKVPVVGQITQLAISPYGDYMAIVTKHTIHITILPESSHLGSQDWSPLKPKTFQLGPTAHVLEQSPIASVLWHPLGFEGHCLVTITTDGIVRLWEVNRDDRSSFSEPTLAVDLKRLANATSADEDMGPTAYGVSKGFTPDSFELEVSAACFGGDDNTGVHGWAPMTLWMAMKEGDVYAMCPLLPSRWQLNRWSVESPIMRSISTTVAAGAMSLEANRTATPDERQISTHQLQWLSEVSRNEPLVTCGATEQEEVEVHSRPLNVPAIPKLQGPFQLTPYPDDDLQLTDIYVTGLKYSDPELEDEDDYDQIDKQEGLAAAVVILVSQDCIIRTCLDLDGVNAQWLPTGSNQRKFSVEDNYRDLLLLEEMNLLTSNDPESISPPTFTLDPYSDYRVFVTHDSGVHYLSMTSWIENLENELSAMQDEGSAFRLGLFLESIETHVEKTISFSTNQADLLHKGSISGPSASIVLSDSDLGYFLLTSIQGQPYAATLDPPHDMPGLPEVVHDSNIDALFSTQLREVYQPPQIFWQRSQLPAFIEKKIPQRHQRSLKEEIRLSPATLQQMTEVHRILSHETHELGLAVADLFRRCDRLRDEFADQLRRVKELNTRIDLVTGDDEIPSSDEDDDEIKLVGAAKIDQRLESAKNRHEALLSRLEGLKKRVSRAGARELSEKEKAWAAEIDKVDRSINKPTYATALVEEDDDVKPAWKRIEEVKSLKEELAPQVESIAQDESSLRGGESVRVSSTVKKHKVQKVMELLDRETALVEAATDRLNRLSVRAL